ncbi:hypothetical protein B0H63DRAFT_461532 [Podospora didyma]|uniref:Uncharacterized protein n=1 Tax=Podospora didyma TaxID=330526 RepID=A0AAE0U894_9PEZI|nr:hypothetical protein B0H63DRAFT_461532 [Podospora didyma]
MACAAVLYVLTVPSLPRSNSCPCLPPTNLGVDHPQERAWTGVRDSAKMVSVSSTFPSRYPPSLDGLTSSVNSRMASNAPRVCRSWGFRDESTRPS